MHSEIRKKRKISITDKFVLYFLIIYIFTGSLLSYLIYIYAGDAIIERTLDQLTTVRVFKTRQIETFFKDRINEIDLILNSNSINSNNINNLSIYLNKFINQSNYFNGYIISIDSNKIINKFFKDKSDSISFSNSFSFDTVTKKIKLFDYQINPISLKPELFIRYSIMNTGRKLDIYFRMPSSEINSIMIENNPKEGLGKSGESYLVGFDTLLRSNSRFFDNSILKIKSNTFSVNSALKGDSVSNISKDYRGIKVLSTASKLNMSDLNWIILAEIDYEEAFIPIENMRIRLMLVTLILSLIIFIITYFIAGRVTKPLIQLTAATYDLKDGSYLKQRIKSISNDEIGDLTESFNSLNDNLKLKEEELRTERIKRYTAEMDAQEHEKERLSKELHDGIGQMFVALKLKLENIDFNANDYLIKIDDIKENIDDTINEIRRISNNLMPSVLYSFGLTVAVNNLIKQINSFGKIKFQFETNVENINDKKTIIYIYRIIQEATNNILKHSKAKNADIKLFESNKYTLLISDDGIGFNLDKEFKGSGNGLYNLRERVLSLGGKINIETSENKGTLIIINLPI
jgi:two-component system NarL family sensor kinase